MHVVDYFVEYIHIFDTLLIRRRYSAAKTKALDYDHIAEDGQGMVVVVFMVVVAASVGERRTDGRLVLGSESPKKDRQVRFAVDMPIAEPTNQDQRAPINMVGGRAWSPGIYRSLRLLGKSLDVAWERVFIHPLTFN